MANRTITIVDNASSKKVVLNGEYTVFGDVLEAARANGINVSGVDFMEGLTKTTFNRADALLPTDVPYKGTTTNNLVFAITKSNKNIKSGYDRNELKIIIQSNNLAEAIKEMFGKNWTICSNEELEHAVNSLCGASAHTSEEYNCEVPCTEEEENNCFYTQEYDNFVISVANLLANLSADTLENILHCVNDIEEKREFSEKKGNSPEVKSPYSDEELEDILANIN